MRDLVRYFDFESVMTGRKCGKRKAAIESDLFAIAADGAGIFDRAPDFFFIAEETIDGRNAGFAKDVVGFQIVELEENAQILRVGEIVGETRADFVRAEHELCEANFS
jgi:hypothetical protein